MSRLFQIYEDDLAELERVLPELLEGLRCPFDNRQKVQVRRVQSILSNVRWNYGPPECVETIDANDPNPIDPNDQPPENPDQPEGV
jgi:hypothetical protein